MLSEALEPARKGRHLKWDAPDSRHQGPLADAGLTFGASTQMLLLTCFS